MDYSIRLHTVINLLRVSHSESITSKKEKVSHEIVVWTRVRDHMLDCILSRNVCFSSRLSWESNKKEENNNYKRHQKAQVKYNYLQDRKYSNNRRTDWKLVNEINNNRDLDRETCLRTTPQVKWKERERKARLSINRMFDQKIMKRRRWRRKFYGDTFAPSSNGLFEMGLNGFKVESFKSSGPFHVR